MTSIQCKIQSKIWPTIFINDE